MADPRRAEPQDTLTATTGWSTSVPQVVRLRPAPHCRAPDLSYSLNVEPEQHFLNWQQDPQATTSPGWSFRSRRREFRVEVDLVAEMTVINPFDFFLEPERRELSVSPTTPTLPRELRAVSRSRRRRRRTVANGWHGVDRDAACAPSISWSSSTSGCSDDIGYLIRMEPGVQTREETLTTAHRFVPRLGVAAGAGAAAPGPGGALRLRLPDPARRPT